MSEEPKKQVCEGHLYLTAARGIQDFILRGNKLKEMIGGSQIVDSLTGKDGSHLFTLMEAVGINWQDSNSCRVLTAAAGGARLWIADEAKARRLFRFWPFVAAQSAPGVEVVQVLLPAGENLAETLSQAETELARQRNRAFPRLPQAGPLAARISRTGEPAVDFKSGEMMDAQQLAKQQAMQKPENAYGLAYEVSKRLGQPWDHKKWPFNFADITNSQGERSYLALIHADGNSLGETWIRLGNKLKQSADNHRLYEIYRSFSETIEETSFHALVEGLRNILSDQERIYPVRPILCAGDDVTLVIRADLAMQFAQSYLEAFEQKSEALLVQLKKDQPQFAQCLPDKIHAGMGIAFVKERFPFSQAYALCESLCKHVKNASRSTSGLAFHRVTTSATADYADLLTSELSSKDKQRRLTMNPYFLKPPLEGRYPLIKDLTEAVKASAELPRGPLRETAAEAMISVELAERRFDRLADVSGKRNKEAWETFSACLRAIVDGPSIWCKEGAMHITPLNDILEIKALTRFETTKDSER